MCYSWQLFYMLSYWSLALYIIIMGILTLQFNQYNFYNDVYLIALIPIIVLF